MYQFDFDSESPVVKKYTVSQNSKPLSYYSVLELMLNDDQFITDWISELRSCSFEAYFFETPAIDYESRDRPFEYVLVKGDSLNKLNPDWSPFKDKFTKRKIRGQVACFRLLHTIKSSLCRDPSEKKNKKEK